MRGVVELVEGLEGWGEGFTMAAVGREELDEPGTRS